ncbi:hypothetical protein ABIB57_004635 [Devosia sp. UYZn731]
MPPSVAAVTVDARRLLRSRYSETLNNSAADAAKAIAAITLPTGRHGKVTRLAVAYALFLVHGGSPRLVNQVAGQTKSSRTPRQKIRVFVEALFKLTPGPHTTKSYSRWTIAIDNLRSSGVLPSELETRARNGEGLDRWSKNQIGPPPSPAVGELGERAIVTIRIGNSVRRWTVPDGTTLNKVEAALKSIKSVRLRKRPS